MSDRAYDASSAVSSLTLRAYCALSTGATVGQTIFNLDISRLNLCNDTYLGPHDRRDGQTNV